MSRVGAMFLAGLVQDCELGECRTERGWSYAVGMVVLNAGTYSEQELINFVTWSGAIGLVHRC